MYDVIIIGGGPAGMTAGIYTLRANLKTLILEKESIGGQIASSPKVENYPGFKSITGSELVNNMYEQVEALGADFELEEVLEIKDGKVKTVITDMNTYQSKVVIIATGAKYRLLGLDNEINLIGKGIHFCTSCDGAFYKDKKVSVIGGGNTAVVNAIYLADICSKVYLICRDNVLKADALLLDHLKDKKNVEILFKSNVTEIIGDEELKEIVIKNDQGDKNILVDGMFISVGMNAETKLAKNLLKMNDTNYIVTDECMTDREGIFVAGDCREKKVRQLTTAINDGAIAATLAINYLKN